MSIYMVFSDRPGGDCPSTLHYLGTNLNKIDLKGIGEHVDEEYDSDSDYICDDEDDNGYKIYVCKYDLIFGGINMCQDLVDLRAQPDLIEQNNIFEGTFEEFILFFRVYKRSIIRLISIILHKLPLDIINSINGWVLDWSKPSCMV
jgi:hypothetical protein